MNGFLVISDAKLVYLLQQLVVSQRGSGLCDGTVMEECHLILVSIIDMPVQCVVADAEFSSDKPVDLPNRSFVSCIPSM